jgi:hypothetical protein
LLGDCGRGHYHQGGGMGQIVKLSRRKHYPPETWVKLSRGFDMGQIVILLNIGQIVIFFLVLALFFFAWEFPAAGA